MTHERTKDLLAFARERHAIYLRRAAGLPKPWTTNEILRSFRFCNVYRELDTVTAWIRTHWREPNALDPDLWFAMLVARFINWPDTLEDIGWPVPWDLDRFQWVMQQRFDRKVKVYTGAYMVRADPETPGEPKYAYQARVVFGPMWERRESLRPRAGDSLLAYHTLLGQFHGLGSFMAAQVVCDLKYARPLLSAPDWHTFAASGPGSRRGLNRVLGRSRDTPWREDDWWMALSELRGEFNAHWVASPEAVPTRRLPSGEARRSAQHPALHAQDLQNVLCEFDKHERVRLGEGRPRARYDGHA